MRKDRVLSASLASSLVEHFYVFLRCCWLRRMLLYYRELTPLPRRPKVLAQQRLSTLFQW
jgi:hypothetical protein